MIILESSKKQNVIIVLLVIIIILLLFLIGFLFIKNNKFDDNQIDDVVNNETSVSEKDNEVIYPDWMQHILDSDIQSITLTRTFNINSESSSSVNVDLTKEDLESIFVKLKECNLIKFNTTGIGVPENQLVISYNYDKKNYNLEFYDSWVRVDEEDKQLMYLINKTNHTDNTGSNPGGIMFKFDNSYNGNIYNIYFEN